MDIPKEIALKGEKVINKYEYLHTKQRGLENEIEILQDNLDDIEDEIKNWYEPKRPNDRSLWYAPHERRMQRLDNPVKKAWLLKGLSDQYTELMLQAGEKIQELDQVYYELSELKNK